MSGGKIVNIQLDIWKQSECVMMDDPVCFTKCKLYFFLMFVSYIIVYIIIVSVVGKTSKLI
jgi:hypothetical protein